MPVIVIHHSDPADLFASLPSYCYLGNLPHIVSQAGPPALQLYLPYRQHCTAVPLSCSGCSRCNPQPTTDSRALVTQESNQPEMHARLGGNTSSVSVVYARACPCPVSGWVGWACNGITRRQRPDCLRLTCTRSWPKKRADVAITAHVNLNLPTIC